MDMGKSHTLLPKHKNTSCLPSLFQVRPGRGFPHGQPCKRKPGPRPSAPGSLPSYQRNPNFQGPRLLHWAWGKFGIRQEPCTFLALARNHLPEGPKGPCFNWEGSTNPQTKNGAHARLAYGRDHVCLTTPGRSHPFDV